MTAVRRNAWVLAARTVPQAGNLVLLVIGARFLDPEALGTFVLIFAWVELLKRLVRAGWREAATLAGEDGNGTAVILALALASALTAQAVTLLSAAALWRWGGLDSHALLCLLVLGTSLLPFAANMVWEGVLLRRNQADREARSLIVAEIVHLAVAAGLLAAGAGILGLAAARLARALANSIGLGRAAGWPLRLSADRAQAGPILRLSANITLSSLVNYLTTYGVDLVIGLFLGPASVAFFRLGSRISGGVADVLHETLRVLSWSAIPASGTADRTAVARTVRDFFDRAGVLSLPLLVGLALVSGPLVKLLAGEAWAPAAPIVALLALARLSQLPTTIACPALAAVGESRRLPRLSLAISLATLALLLLAAPFGLSAIVWSQLAAGLVGGAAAIAAIERTALRDGRRLRPAPDLLAGAALMAAAVGLAGLAGGTGAAALAGQILAGALAYAAFLRWRRPELWDELTRGLHPSSAGRASTDEA